MNKRQIRFRFFSHTADVKIRAYGKDFETCFENAVHAIKKIWIHDRKGKKEFKKKIRLEAYSLERLFYEFIEEFIVLFDSEFIFPVELEDLKIVEENGKNYTLETLVWFDYTRNVKIYTGIKAITYSEMEFSNRKGRKFIQFIVDL